RVYLQHVNAFMKNTFIRSFNGVYTNATTIAPTHGAFPAFVAYIASVSEVLRLHIEGDAKFFNTPSDRLGGKCLADILGLPGTGWSETQASVEALKGKALEWKEAGGISPDTYSATELIANLSFIQEMRNDMQAEIDCLDEDGPIMTVSDEDLKRLIAENLDWFASQNDVTFLLPYVIAHHDPAVTPSWPPMKSEATAALPEFVKQHEESWQFAPYHPLTREKQTWSS
ncbi:hypothetical protein FISHEDRAFT_32358, partial [Fistulina hepatica ATCC 64428]